MGKPELVQDLRFATPSARKQNEDELDSIISGWTSTRDRWEITEALQRAGVAAFPSMSNQDLATNEHLRERGYLVRLEHPEVGRRTHVGIPWTLGGKSSEVASPAPLRGTDTDAVLSKLLGYSTAKIDRLRNAGTLS
jgi:crotonobetainyl-CoA:carnitine CoA-transferase CaiB-like acyl-CoA transferase